MRAAGEEELLRKIWAVYGDLARPNYSFVDKVLRKDPYRELIDLMAQYYRPEDHTDTNEDVAYRLEISTDDSRAFMVELSFLGPVYCLFEISKSRAFFVSDATSVDLTEARIHETIANAGFAHVPTETLDRLTPLRSRDLDKEYATFYEALFSVYGSHAT